MPSCLVQGRWRCSVGGPGTYLPLLCHPGGDPLILWHLSGTATGKGPQLGRRTLRVTPPLAEHTCMLTAHWSELNHLTTSAAVEAVKHRLSWTQPRAAENSVRRVGLGSCALLAQSSFDVEQNIFFENIASDYSSHNIFLA